MSNNQPFHNGMPLNNDRDAMSQNNVRNTMPQNNEPAAAVQARQHRYPVAGNNQYEGQLVDGHIHTELCPHGSGDKVALIIEKAIELGFINFVLLNMHHYRSVSVNAIKVMKRGLLQLRCGWTKWSRIWR